MKIWKECEKGWTITREDGAIVMVTWDEARDLQETLRRYDAWDEVDCRIESGYYKGHVDAIAEAKENIIDAILEETEVEIDGDVVYDAISKFVDLDEDEEYDEED